MPYSFFDFCSNCGSTIKPVADAEIEAAIDGIVAASVDGNGLRHPCNKLLALITRKVAEARAVNADLLEAAKAAVYQGLTEGGKTIELQPGEPLRARLIKLRAAVLRAEAGGLV